MDIDNNPTQEQVDYEVSLFEQSPNVNWGMDFEYYSPFRVDAKNASETSWESFLQKVNNLSVPIKDILTDASTVEFILTLAEHLELTDNQSADLSRIIRDILIGNLSIDNLATTLGQKLNLDQDTARQVQNNIINNLLAPAIEDIRKIQTERFPEKTNRPELKMEPGINRNNVVDLRNK